MVRMVEEEPSFEGIQAMPKSASRQLAESQATKILQNSKLFGTPERIKKSSVPVQLKDFETFNDSSIQYSIPC